MRALAVCSWVVIAAALAGCTFEHDGPDCQNTAIVDGETLVGASLEILSEDALPPVSGEIEARGIRCDRPGTYGFKTLEGLPPQAALLADDQLYLGKGFLLTTKRHPLYRVVARELQPDPRPIRGCGQGRLRGTVVEVESFSKRFRWRTSGRLRYVTMHPHLEADLPRVGGLPRLTEGMRVVAEGRRCPSGRFYAFRLTGRR